MPTTIDYYLVPQSPWTYLGHARFAGIARAAGVEVKLRPIDLGRVFPISGGLPLGKRAPQRQAYRLVDMARSARHLDLPINVEPKYFPVAGDDAARLMSAVDQHDGADAAMALTGAILAAVWVQQRDIADAAVLQALLEENGLHGERLAQSKEPSVQQRYEADTQRAIDAGVFGAPSYVLDGEIFWGQDRLDLLERALQAR
ncbi:MAG: 2-hydroxychromene-2-carboxylate isomerase [Comamonadaceae bacterium]|nr:MAG: 2-hydroxychromene-2-carboxylate isomerase [Comamonadaceae bacterium]